MTVPSEIPFYTALGMSLVVPFALGVAGATVLGHIVTHRPAIDRQLLVVGIAWGCIIVIVDRLILSVRTRGALKVLFNMLRITLAVCTAIVLTEPMLAVWFGNEAIARAQTAQEANNATAITALEHDYAARRGQATAAAVTRAGELETEIKRLQGLVDAARSNYAERQKLCQDEMAGRNGGDPGVGPQAQILCGAANTALDDLRSTQASTNTRVVALQKELAALGKPVQALNAAEQSAIAAIKAHSVKLKDLGLWDRIELTDKTLALWWHIALAGTLVALDTLPVLIKASRGRTAHDELLDLASATAVTHATASAAHERAELDRDFELDREINALGREVDRDIARAAAQQRGADTKARISRGEYVVPRRPVESDGGMPTSIGARRRRLVAIGAGALALVVAVSAFAIGRTPSRHATATTITTAEVTVPPTGPTVIDLGSGARLVVPQGAITPGAKVQARVNGAPASTWNGMTPIRPAVELVATPTSAIRGVMTLEFPVPRGKFDVTTAKKAFGIATLDTRTNTWKPFPATYDAAHSMIVARIPHFSWWNPFSWDWASLGARINQDIGQVVGQRAGQAACTSGLPVPGWVNTTAGVTNDASVAVRSCTEGHQGDVLVVQLQNNRAYGQMVTYGAPVQWGWSQEGDSAKDRARNAFARAITPANQLYLPPLGRASIGIPRPDQPYVAFHIGASPQTVAADVLAELLDVALGKINGAACGNVIAGAPFSDFVTADTIRTLFEGGLTDCIKESVVSAGTVGALDHVTVSNLETMLDGFEHASTVGNLVEFYNVEWKVADLYVDTQVVGGAGSLGNGFSILRHADLAPATTTTTASPQTTPTTQDRTTTTTAPNSTTSTTAPSTTTTTTPQPVTRGFHIADAFMGGTWARTDPNDGTWYSHAHQPPNGKYWYPNGLGVAVDCVRSAAAYRVRFASGVYQTWTWWAHVTDNSWVPVAVFQEVWNDGSQGLASC